MGQNSAKKKKNLSITHWKSVTEKPAQAFLSVLRIY